MPATRSLVVALAAAGTLALAACAPGALDADPSRSGSPTPTPVPPPSDAPADPNPSAFEPAPSVAPTIGPVAGDLDLACDEILTPQQVYDFNPQMLGTDAPASGLPEAFASIADDGGVVCAWQHSSSGDVLLVGVADAAGSDAVDSPGLATRTRTVGDWSIVVGSPYFEGADDQADAMIDEIGANLP